MVCKLECDCSPKREIQIDSLVIFQQVKTFFVSQTNKKVYVELKPEKPFYVWKNGDKTKEWYATKWYRCKACNCLWEVNYPDFPAKGFVRKFEDGIYKERGY